MKKLSETLSVALARKAEAKAKRERWEDMFALHVRGANLPLSQPQYRFDASRDFRFDRAWPQYMIAAEIEGLVPPWYGGGKSKGKGRHQTVQGFSADCKKYNRAVELGWELYRYTPKMIESGEAIAQITRVLRQRIEARK